MKREQTVEVHDLEIATKRLPGCTLTASEAVRLASTWWDKVGRRLMNVAANRERVGGIFRAAGAGGPAIKTTGSEETVLPSRILEGLPWDELDRGERHRVVTAWLSQYRQQYAAGEAPRVVLQ